MAKPDKPIFSLGARGTIGDALTYQKRGRATIVREKPIPKDPYSLNQAYQRWDYRDYAYLWTLLSNSEKQIYRTKASRYHITGFSQWMRENLKDLTNLVARWHLDEPGGAVAFDTSQNDNNGIIVGASPATGLISGAYYFDGLNDNINCGNSASLQAAFLGLHPWAIEMFFKPMEIPAVRQSLMTKHFRGFLLGYATNQKVQISIVDAAGTSTAISNQAASVGDWHHLVVNRAPGLQVFLDNIPGTLVAETRDLETSGASLLLGRRYNPFEVWFKGYEDEVRIYDRTLDATERLRHSERRYP